MSVEKQVKRVRKVKKTAIELTDYLKAIQENPVEDVVVKVELSNKSQEVHVKQHIDFAVRKTIVESVRDAYFSGGTYDPTYGDSLRDLIIMQIYTDMNFANDFGLFEKFKYCNSGAYGAICDAYPAEVNDVISDIDKLVDVELEKISIPVQQESFYFACSNLVDSLSQLISGLSSFLDAAQESLSGVDATDVKDLISALSFIGKQDEKKVAKAILNFQQEKAKRSEKVAVKGPSDEDVPRI